MTLEYTYGRKQQLALLYFQGRAHEKDSSWRYYQQCFTYWLLYCFGIWLAYKAESLFGVAVFTVMLVYAVCRQIPYSRVLEELYESSLTDVKERHIELEFDQRGLTETESGVVSFCPWESVVSYSLYNEILFIELKSEDWAIIDPSAFSREGQSLEGIIAELKNQHISSLE